MILQSGFISVILGTVIASSLGRVLLSQNELQQTPKPSIQPRIIGGELAVEGSFPYIVAINSTHGNHVCGGSIITAKYVLTAAHCLEYPAEFLIVLTGAAYLRSPDAVYAVEESIAHCSYNKPWMHNDIGLLRLAKRIVYNSLTQPIQMATDTTLLKEGDMLTISGWGGTKKYGRSSPYLITAEVKFISVRECEERVKNKAWLGPKNICTCTKSRKGSCNNDSGGPLVSNGGHLVGVVNWGEPCAIGRPDVFASVAHHIAWIRRVITGVRTVCESSE